MNPLKKIIIYITIVAVCLTTLVCFTSCEQESEYTITFYENNGIYFYNSATSDKQIMTTKYQDTTVYKVEKISGGYVSEPVPPTNEGYVFLGWYQNPECTEKFLFGHYEIKSDINLYAKWGK